MNSQDIRTLVEQFFAARADDGDAIAVAISDDAVWAPPAGAGIGQFRGRDDVVAALTGGDAGKVFKIDTMQREVHQIVIEGDTAVAFMTTTADLVNGNRYENEYVWRCTCADGKITRLDEYTDTLRAFKQFGLV